MQRKIWFFVGIGMCVLFRLSVLSYASQESIYQYNEEGVVKLNNKDYKGAIEAFKQAYRLDPHNKKVKKNLAITYNNYGYSYMSKGDVHSAIEKYEYALSYDSDNVYTLYNLGQAYYKIQKISLAKEYLHRAHQLDSSMQGIKDLLEKVFREEKTEKAFDAFETMHFIIVASADIAIENASYIKIYLEEAYGKIGNFLNYYPKERVVVVLYSEQNYEELLRGRPHWAMAIFDGKMRIPVNKFKYSNREDVQIIYHEYSHALVYELTKDRCPLWLNEGIACFAEDFIQVKSKDFARSYIEEFGIMPLRHIPSNFTSINDRELATLMYVQSYLLVNYVVKRNGYAGLHDLLRFVGSGVDISEALQRVFDEDIDDFQAKFKQFVIEEYNIKKLRFRL